MLRNISVIGAGSWGTAIAVLLAQNGHIVKVWTRFAHDVDIINTNRRNVAKLPEVEIPKGVTCTNDFEDCLKDSDIILMVLPSQVMRYYSRKIAKYVKPGTIVVNCSKGLEENTFLRLSQVIGDEIPQSQLAVLSGPSHAEEVALGIPTSIVAASENIKVAQHLQDVFMSSTFRVYYNTDVVGVEYGGAFKNVIALCAGISDGLGFGDNTKAALMTRGIAEFARLGMSMGAELQTFAGLAGIGDLIVTCTSMHSRNRRVGILIGQGRSLEDALSEVKMVAEGVITTRVAYELSKKKGIEMPITTQAFNVLFNGKNAREAVSDLMAREKCKELF
jgi:glycerol-3-phosphate dehydrogenase (NAD(P)+)